MKSKFLEAGQIVNTHGVRGEVKIVPWADSPAFLAGFKTLYLDGGEKPLRVDSARVHKSAVLVKFSDVGSVERAMALKGKTVFIAREDADLEPGAFFLADLIGLEVWDEAGNHVGTLVEVLTPPAHNIYVVESSGREYMIPAVPEFVKKVDLDKGEIIVALIEGM